MYSICLIDDRCYGIPQLINGIPNNVQYEFFYFDRVQSIEKREYNLILLDYFLDKDNITWADIIDSLNADIIIAFSSEDEKNDLLLAKWAKYKVTKLQWVVRNEPLSRVLKGIMQ